MTLKPKKHQSQTLKHQKAVVMLSGGLDSTLATAILREQGIDVNAVFFTLPFYAFNKKGKMQALGVAKRLGIRLKIIKKDKDFIWIVKKPKHGYGKGMNPCIDCRIFMLREAKKYARDVGASFIATGEVLGERPMSQHRRALEIIDRESGLKGRILRPLSAKLLSETEVEKKGLVDRNQLLDISGRQRKRQLELAKTFGITEYEWPAGGCLLTDKYFAKKLRDLFKNKERITLRDIELLKVGRHFRQGENKIIVGRDENENKTLFSLKLRNQPYFEVEKWGSPITLLQGPISKIGLMIAAKLTAYYSDCKNDLVLVNYGTKKLDKTIHVTHISKIEVDKLRIK